MTVSYMRNLRKDTKLFQINFKTMSDFKFDIKLKPKTVGEFDVANPPKWTLLIKSQFKDETLFVHLHCIFQEPLTEEQKANGVVEPFPIIEITKGFMKDGYFIPTDKKTVVSAPDRLHISKKYGILMEALIEDGFIKHGEMYLGAKEAESPVYHVNEKGRGAGGFDLAAMMQNFGMPQNPGATIPQTKNPILRMKAQKFSTVKPQASTSVGNQNNP